MARQVAPVTPPPPPGRPGGLGEKIEATIQRAFAWLFNAARHTLVEILSAGLELFLEVLEPVMASRVGPLIDEILKVENLPTSLRQYLERLRAPTAQADGVSLLGMLSGIGMSAASAFFAPLFRSLNYEIDRKMRTARADPSAIWPMIWRWESQREMLLNHLRDLGWSEEMITLWEKILRPRPGSGDLIAAELREIMPPEMVETELKAQGWTSDAIWLMRQLAQQIPSPSDLITMAVREAFDEEASRRLGLDAAFPTVFAEWMRKQGFSEDWARKYWRAHWQLPSAQMGFEMLHREVINEDDLRYLLRALDIAPIWHERLMRIAYAVPTRVDVRRMYQMGVIDRDQVKKAYMWEGYDEHWAELMTQWTEKEYQPAARDLSKSDILSGYREGLLGREEAKQFLMALGYDAEEADFYLSREELEYAKQIEKEQLRLIEIQFKNGLIDENQARGEMTKLGLPSRQIELNIELWKAGKREAVKRPSVSRLEDFYLRGIIDASVLRQELAAMGYSPRYIDWYLQDLDAEAQEKAQAEAERAAKEAERAAEAKIRKEYQQAVAQIDLQIALERQRIVNARAALNATLTDEQILALEDRIAQMDAQIAGLRAEIARQQEARTAAQNELRKWISDAERERLESTIDQITAEIDALNEDIAALKVEQARLHEELVVTVDAERKSAIKQQLAQIDTQIAERKAAIEALRSQEDTARAELRAKIPDDARQRLERQIRDADNQIASLEREIAEVREQQAALKLAISRAMKPEDRAALEKVISDAQQRIAELQVEKAKLKTGER